MRSPVALQRRQSQGAVEGKARVAKGYGSLVWLPFAVIIVAMAALSHSAVLFGSSLVWASCMAFMGARIPMMVFACFLQVTSAITGCAYLGAYGHYPSGVADTQLAPWAVAALELGLLVVAAVYWGVVRYERPGDPRLGESNRMLKLGPTHLFILLLIVFSPEWLRLPLQPSSTGGFRQIVQHIVNFRMVLYCIFLINCIRANRKKAYYKLIFISIYIALPMSVTGHAGWSSIVILALMVFASSLVFPIARGGARLSAAGISVAMAAVVFLAGFGLIWEGGLKGAWRSTLSEGSGDMSMTASLSAFADQATTVMQQFNLSQSLEVLTSRMSSGEGFSSLVLRNVPRAIPYANGERSMGAIGNLLPRVIFRNKADLGGDSWLVRKYAQVDAAGDEEGASIGLGYVSEFYIDYGVIGIVAGSAALGLLFASGIVAFRMMGGRGDLANAAMAVIFYTTFTTPDASLTKMVGALASEIIVFAGVIYFVNRYLYVRFRTPTSADPALSPRMA